MADQLILLHFLLRALIGNLIYSALGSRWIFFFMIFSQIHVESNFLTPAD